MATESTAMGVINAYRPSFRDRNPHNKLAFSVNASFVAAGFDLVATCRNASTYDPETDGPAVGIEGWNETEENYVFVYSKIIKGRKKSLLLSCLVCEDLLLVTVVDAIEIEKEPIQLSINVEDYVADCAEKTSNYGEMYKDFKGLVEKLNANIFAKLEPQSQVSSSVSSDERSEHNTTDEPAVGIPDVRQLLPPGGSGIGGHVN